MEKRVGLQLPHRKRLRAETRMGFLLHSRQHPDLNWTKEPVRAGEVKQFPFRVKCCPDGPEVRLPFFPEQRTSTDRLGWSGLSHIRTHAARDNSALTRSNETGVASPGEPL